MTQLSPQPPNSDLSPYELLRLQKIQRNQARLKALGFGGEKTKSSFSTSLGGVSTSKKRRIKDRHPQRPTRYSKRLKAKQGNDQVLMEEKNVDSNEVIKEDIIEIHYSDKHFPKEPQYLDDDEFQVYASLRAWRLKRKNELDVEPYKICQNRTLVELIRRVRNNPTWGTGVKRSVAADLIECWGLGPSKVSPDGFGPEMMSIIGEDRNKKLLDASRARSQSNRDEEEK